MSDTNILQKHEELLSSLELSTVSNIEAKIIEASQKYYSDGTSDIDDLTFDQLVDILRGLKPDSQVFQKPGWGYNPYKNSTAGQKVKHKYGLVGSLDKAYSLDEISKELKNTTNVRQISLKLDGISAVCYYENGVLDKILTRGDGTVGIDITDKAHILVPSHLTDEYEGFTLAVRGELVMDEDNWNQFHEKYPESLNPRNSVAGLVNRKDRSEDFWAVEFVPYTVIGSTSLLPGTSWNLQEVMKFIEHTFQHHVPYSIIPEGETITQEVVDSFSVLVEVFSYSGFPYDGLVIKDNNISIDENSQFIYTAQAYKFKAESAETVVRDIEWSLTKTKYLMPRILFDNIFISGTNVSACTGYNAAYIKDNDIGVGTKLIVSKHGEIIPNIDEVIESTGAELPTVCPCCGSQLQWEGVHLCCKNPECEDAHLKDVLIWFDKLVPVKGLSDSLRTKFLREAKSYGWISDITIGDVMNVSSQDDGYEWMLESVCSKQARMFVKSWISLLKWKISVTWEDALTALNIPRLSTKTASKIAKNTELLELLRTYLESLEASGLQFGEYYHHFLAKLEEVVGTATAESVDRNRNKFLNLLCIYPCICIEDSTKFEDMKIRQVAITGSLSMPRKEFESFIAEFGFKVGDITKSTFCLITDDPNSNSSKNAKADKYGIPKISETDFLSKYVFTE